MAALNFPDPNVTTSYTNPDTGITYEWANGVWKSVSSALTAPELFVDADGDNLTGNLTLGTDKIVLNATDGSATFDGVLKGNQRIIANGGGGKTGASATFLNYAGDASTVTAYITADGNAEFAGSVSANNQLALYRATTTSSKFLLTAKSDVGGTEQLKFALKADGTTYFASNVGIGVLSPAANLDVLVNSASDSEIRVRNNVDGLRLMMQADGTSLIRSVFNRGIIFGSGTGNSDATFKERLRIDSSGRVGVGQTSPTAILHTKTATTSGYIITENSASHRWIFGPINDTYAQVGGLYGTHTGIAVDLAGNAGIGTTSPDAKLHAVGEIRYGSNTTYYGTVDHDAASTGANIYNSVDSGGHIFKRNNTIEQMRIDSAGRLLLSTTTEGFADVADNFTIADSGNCGMTIRSGSSNAGSIYFSDATFGSGEYDGYIDYQHSSQALRFGTNAGTERLRIGSDGNVIAKRARSNTAGDVALSVHPSDTTVNYGFRIDSATNSFNLDRVDNSSTFLSVTGSGNVLIGGSTAATADIALNADGSASFAGPVNAGNVSIGSDSKGTFLSNGGLIRVQRKNEDSGDATVFEGYFGNTSTATSLIKADGSAEFAGDVVRGTYAANSNYCALRDGQLEIGRNTNDGNLTLIKGTRYNGATTYDIFNFKADGSATFAKSLDVGLGTGKVVANDGGYLYIRPETAEGVALDIYNSNNAATASVKGDGSATFAGGDVNIDSSGVVRIGGTDTYNGSDKLTLVNNSGNCSLTIDSTSTGESSVFFADGATGNEAYRGYLQYQHSSDSLLVGTAGSERMRIINNGQILLNTTNSNAIHAARSIVFTLEQNGDIAVNHSTANGSGDVYARFGYNGTQIGSITQNGTTAVAYNTSSDYRLKENVVPLTGAANRVNQLQVHRFNFIADPSTTVDGFLAHEAQAVVPEAVTGTHNEVDDDGNAVMQGIDQSKLVPLLTAALQEAIAKIETLEQRLSDAGIA